MICGLDLGSSKIKILIAKKNKEDNLELVSKAERESEGIRRGIIVDKEKVSNILTALLQQTSSELGKRISGVYASLNGSHLFSLSSRGLVSVSRADQKISEEDVQRVIQAAQSVNLPLNREIFDTFVREFIIDGQSKTKEAVGLQGVRLEADVLILAGFTPYLERQKKAILDADLEILDIIASPLASARAVLSPRQKELGCAVLDIGAGTTGLAVFEEEALLHLAILPIGSSNITNDIAIRLKIDTEIAEILKKEYGSCSFKGKDTKIKLDLKEGDSIFFSKKSLAKVISERVSEIFEQVNLELRKIGKEKMLPGGIVLCGGGAKLNGILELAREKLKLPVKIGKPKSILGMEEDPAWTVVCGLVLFGADFQKDEKEGAFQKLILKAKDFLKNFIP